MYREWRSQVLAVVVAVVALALVSAPASAQFRIPEPVGFINDFANVIPPEYEARIQQVIDEVRAKSGGEIVVVTLPSLEGRPIDEVALRIGREWGVGRKGDPGDPARNTGVVVLVVPKETSPDGRGHLKIETGIGTTTFITAAEAGRIADDYMVPAFRERDYGRGILEGVVAIAQEYAERFGFELTGEVVREVRRDGSGTVIGHLIFWLIVIFALRFLLAAWLHRGHGRRNRRFGPWPYGGYGPRGRGHGGGFGGGGAGRSW